jgi:uncharacterized protein YajQ (UPF0234 family)
MPSFDIVCDPNWVDIKHAVDNTAKEIGTRFDFKGSSAAIELKEKDKVILLTADADFQLAQVLDILRSKLSKREVDVRFIDPGKIEKIGGDRIRQTLTVRSGLSTEQGKKVQVLIKESKLKLQAAIQGDVVRVSGVKKDELQTAMALVREKLTELPLGFQNFRD